MEEKLFRIGCAMAQELRETADAAEEAGSPLPHVEAILEEWEQVASKYMGGQQ